MRSALDAITALSLDRFTAWLPNQCAVCRSGTRGPAGRICAACATRFAAASHRCIRCAIQKPEAVSICGACVKQPPPWSRAVAACDYAYPWDGLLQGLKFNDALDLAPALSKLLGAAIARAAAAPDDNPPPDVLLPVPLSRERLRQRGYNQAAILAKPLSRALQIPLEVRWLLRLVDTEHQLALPREARRDNVRGAFAVEPLALPKLRDRRVALIDDVMTTGATAAELTRVLLQAGARSVQVWIVARTPR